MTTQTPQMVTNYVVYNAARDTETRVVEALVTRLDKTFPGLLNCSYVRFERGAALRPGEATATIVASVPRKLTAAEITTLESFVASTAKEVRISSRVGMSTLPNSWKERVTWPSQT